LKVVARALLACFDRLEEASELGRREEVLGAFMTVRGAGCTLPRLTLYISPLGRPRRHSRNLLLLLEAA